MKKACFHLHTHHSFDCWTNPKHIVDIALKNKIDYLVITDHDSTAGSCEANGYADKNRLPIEIPISAEYHTDIGDIIVVGVPPDFQKIFDHRILCKTVKSLGGHTILPHPYDGHDLKNADFTHIDCIEIFNSRSSELNNGLAKDLALSLNKNPVFRSDAHFLTDVCNTVFEYSGNTPFESEGSFPSNFRYTPQYRKDFPK